VVKIKVRSSLAVSDYIKQCKCKDVTSRREFSSSRCFKEVDGMVFFIF